VQNTSVRNWRMVRNCSGLSRSAVLDAARAKGRLGGAAAAGGGREALSYGVSGATTRSHQRARGFIFRVNLFCHPYARARGGSTVWRGATERPRSSRSGSSWPSRSRMVMNGCVGWNAMSSDSLRHHPSAPAAVSTGSAKPPNSVPGANSTNPPSEESNTQPSTVSPNTSTSPGTTPSGSPCSSLPGASNGNWNPGASNSRSSNSGQPPSTSGTPTGTACPPASAK